MTRAWTRWLNFGCERCGFRRAAWPLVRTDDHPEAIDHRGAHEMGGGVARLLTVLERESGPVRAMETNVNHYRLGTAISQGPVGLRHVAAAWRRGSSSSMASAIFAPQGRVLGAPSSDSAVRSRAHATVEGKAALVEHGLDPDDPATFLVLDGGRRFTEADAWIHVVAALGGCCGSSMRPVSCRGPGAMPCID